MRERTKDREIERLREHGREINWKKNESQRTEKKKQSEKTKERER